jgi:capsular exopolysaccharide synthesis family protein
LNVIRRHAGLIVAVGILCGAVALGISLAQKRSYQAQATLVVSDPNEALTLVGGSVVSGQTPLQLASSHAPKVTRVAVLERVRAQLGRSFSIDNLKRSVAVSVDPTSDVVDITASAGNAAEAAQIANAFAQEDAALTTGETRQLYLREARNLETRLAHSTRQDAATKSIYTDQLARLQELASVAAPVQVNSAATVPSSPSSPRPVSNTVTGLLLGLLLGLMLAFAREAFDRRLRKPDDVQQLMEHPVIGHVRSHALGHAWSPAVNGRGPLAPADEESFRILRHNLAYLAATEPIRTVLVTSAIAAEGKSTVAACLAAANAATGKRTLLVECDLRRPVLAPRLGLAKTPGLSDYLTGNARPDDILQVVPTDVPGAHGSQLAEVRHEPASTANLVCITAGTPAPRPAELLGSDRFRAFVQAIGQTYDAVILDGTPILTVADAREILPEAGGVLVCVRLAQTTRDQVIATRQALDRLPPKPIGIVLTNVTDSEDGYYGYSATAVTAGV